MRQNALQLQSSGASAKHHALTILAVEAKVLWFEID
jgi:hypothetical protein